MMKNWKEFRRQLLDKLLSIYDKKCIGIYQDNGLAVLKNLSGPELERVQKTVTKCSKAID